jgi:hypothetical protein
MTKQRDLDTFLEDKQDWTLRDFQHEVFIKTVEVKVRDESLVKARSLLEGYKEEVAGLKIVELGIDGSGQQYAVLANNAIIVKELEED